MLHGLVAAALLGVAAWAVSDRRDELLGARHYLDHLRYGWVASALALEAASFVAFGGVQRRLLAAGGLDLGLDTLTAIALAGNALQSSLPAGPAVANVWAYRQFRDRGADDVLAAWTLVATSLLSEVALAAMAGAGVAAAGSAGFALDLVGVTVGVVAVTALGVLAWRRQRAMAWLAARLLGLTRRLFGWPHREPRDVVEDLFGRVRAIQPSRRDWSTASGLALSNWLLDGACLAMSFLAVGAEVPWRGLLLAYAAGQLAASLPVTPGGLGVVEGSLTIALVAYGGIEASTVAAVLLYRLVSFWLPVPAGWAVLGVLSLRRRRTGQVSPLGEGPS